MPVYKDTKGKWYVKYSYNVNGKRHQKLKRGFDSRRAASAWESQERAKGIVPITESFLTVFENYLIYSDASDTSAYLKRTFVTKHFPLHTKPINRITKEMLVDWRNTLKSSGMATRTVNRGMSYVRAVFSYATEVYGIPNVGTVLKSYKLTKQDKAEMKVWTPQEFQQFIDAVPEGYYKAYFSLLYWTGVRRSEGLAVCKDDFDGNKLHIWRSIKHFSNGFLPLKTDTSERTISLDKKTMDLLRPYINKANPFVFGGVRSLPITNVQREFTKAVTLSGVKAIRIHDLRHSHASFLIAQGVPIIAVSRRLGHASVTVTLNTYAHLLQETEDEMVATIDLARQRGEKR